VERGSNFNKAGRTNPNVAIEARSTGSMRIVNSRLAAVVGARAEAAGRARRPAHMQITDVAAKTMKKIAQHREMESR
jgi:hypothetical protein